jgi:hypothetical protein
VLTISRPLSASQVRTYHEREFASERQNYWSRDQQGHSEWQGKLAEQWGLEGAVGRAKEYAKSPEGTLVVSLDNCSRVEINERIRAEMQERGLVSKDEHRIAALVPRQDLTGPERTWAVRYEFNDVVRYAPS